MHQPIHWQPWGEDAFARAKNGNLPVLLAVGALWCQDCLAMDHKFYESADIAAIVNEHYIAVKVDCDERPDLDARYQAAVAATGEQGGLPLTMFLTSAGKPFYGTCFSPLASNGQSRFREILLAGARAYREHRDEVEQESGKLLDLISHTESQKGNSAAFTASVVEEIVRTALDLFHSNNGGFGAAPQSPRPAMLDLLLHWYAQTGDERAGAAVTTALEKMARSGVYDQIGGGFHRSAKDGVPHFEKLTCVNSELLKAYVHAWQVTGNPFFADVARGIMRWMDASLSDRERGGFFASQRGSVGLDDKQRPIPYIDRTIYTGWNALCISAYLKAARAFCASENNTAYGQAQKFALRSLDRLLAEAWNGEQLDHVVAYANGDAGHGTPGELDDYAFTVLACLDAYEATSDLHYFEQTQALGVQMFKYFYEGVFGAFIDLRQSCSPLGALRVLRKPFRDALTPAGNPAAAIALLRIYAFTSQDIYQDRARQTLEVIAGIAGDLGIDAGTYGIASMWLSRPHTQVVIVGDGAQADELYAAAVRSPALTKAVLRIPSGNWDSLPPALGETIANLPEASAGYPLAVVCSAFTCSPPVRSAAGLTALLSETSAPSLCDQSD